MTPSSDLDRVVIINDRSARIGGASNLAILSASLLQEAGVAVTYFAGDTVGSERPASDTVNLAARPLMQQPRLSALASGLYSSHAYDGLKALMARVDSKGTIYHVHGWSKILSPSIFRALWPVRGRVVLHAHDYFLSCPNGGFANYRRGQVCSLTPMSLDCLATNCDKRGYHEKIWRSARHMVREHYYPIQQFAANIVVVHQRMRDYFARGQIDMSNIETIRNPVEPFLDYPIEPWKKRDFFFVGRLEPEKGFEDAALAARLAGVKLQIIGDGAGRARLERDFPEVVIHGWKSKGEMREILGDARALVVSSRVPEPFGLAALEAVTSGIPVILPDMALLGDELAMLGCGSVFQSGKVEALAGGLRRLAGDDMLLRLMSVNCLRRSSEMAHTPASWRQALLALYDRVLERANAARTSSQLTARGGISAGHRLIDEAG
ncbi:MULTISPECIES: glycosyltransferase family 4 protein [unclassified Rhizobium]|jgi:glycosyltransferase involved in cell wall biosynthesis|uniref:glycosyltransferase family 4 protein n=1 Tax=unclassified Rhizobium TaxID=2613769 RepID=UPI00068D7491|nr:MULTISPECIES: glycosyltransferase family 4 protein [unclassified Rhizobium]MBN8952380.1 glycosyltransferase family 4 protein [Rhizobium tropici]OJY78873.1 MAG: glycosyl transferase family 1 [Rhizobium sp. 60-20]RKD35642.1 glycosyltransferase involved in cell wall biosynthesis [Rhizobium sp. WW_1]